VLPRPLKRVWLQAFFSYSIHPTARIGFSLVLPRHLEMGPGSSIGHLNVIKGLSSLNLGEDSSIGNLNWVTGFPEGHSRHFVHQRDRVPELILGEQSAITHRHYVDCTNRVKVGRFTTIAGYATQFLSHSIDLEQDRQSSLPIEVGDYCFVGSNCVLLGGSALPDFSVLGAKSLLNKKFTEGSQLYGGVPAKALRSLPKEWRYFQREKGFVD
jgi:acetyltransferase-like isoleucine patch superfamily enzyme